LWALFGQRIEMLPYRLVRLPGVRERGAKACEPHYCHPVSWRPQYHDLSDDWSDDWCDDQYFLSLLIPFSGLPRATSAASSPEGPVSGPALQRSGAQKRDLCYQRPRCCGYKSLFIAICILLMGPADRGGRRMVVGDEPCELRRSIITRSSTCVPPRRPKPALPQDEAPAARTPCLSSPGAGPEDHRRAGRRRHGAPVQRQHSDRRSHRR
jgi:hypothetical protein